MELVDSIHVCELLNIKPNYLHQLQHRKQLNWVKKDGRKVYYDKSQVLLLKATRDAKNRA